MNTEDLKWFLKEKVEIFQGFDDEILNEVINQSRQVTFEANEAVIEFGRPGRFLGILLDGEAEVSITTDYGEKHVLNLVTAGGLFGVPSLMTGDKTMADVIGLTACEAMFVPNTLFSTIISNSPSAIGYLSKVLIDRQKSMAKLESDHDLGRSALLKSNDPYGFRLRTDEPMRLLAINCGSSSIKYNFYDTFNEEIYAGGTIEKIGEEGTQHEYESSKGNFTVELPKGGHTEAFAAMVEALSDRDRGVVKSARDITAIGHRVAHGGDKYSQAVVIDDSVLDQIESLCPLAPLHNPIHLAGIKAAMTVFPDAKHVAVFDTAFHQTMPPYAFLYGLPYEYFKKGVRKYGFHGTSHKYVSLKVAEHLKRPYNELETIICHLGNGASICAVDHGRSVDTTMGFTPLEGLIMGTRVGNLDPGALLHLMRTEGLNHEQLDELLNKKSGLLGLSGVSNDMREIVKAANEGDHRALITVRAFSYRIRKFIGSYMAAMGGLDAIAFTGGIGQGSVGVRTLSCQGLDRMGVIIDEEKNRKAGFNELTDITGKDSKVRVLVVPTDEQRMIAREIIKVLDESLVSNIIKHHEPIPIPIEISAHHVHLQPDHVSILFGEGHELTPLQELSQPGQYACEERVHLVGPRGRVDNVRVLGPARKQTQVEIAMTEQFKLGVQAPIRESGYIEGTPGLTLEGPAGSLHLEKGVVCALRHIHMTPEEAMSMGLKDKDVVRVRVPGEREVIFGDTLIRVKSNFRLAMHLDTDEGNAADITTGMVGYIEGIQSRR